MKLKVLFFAAMLLANGEALFSQTLPVGQPEYLEDAYRRQQLLGIDTSKSSFMIRPLYLSERNNLAVGGSEEGAGLQDWNRLLWQNEKGNAQVRVLPVIWQNQITSHHPYGFNDGAMVPAKGYQTMISAGIYAKYGPLSVQLRPEYVYAQNSDYVTLSEAGNGVEFINAYRNFVGRIDQPERFGKGSYSKLGWGQSSVRLSFDPVSVGLSNENLWWGPGTRGSLLMSNNADGFKHLTLNTTRPVNTPIGSFEGQLIAGRLETSGFSQPENAVINAKPDDWRYLSGLALTYQPKWIPGLFLGLDRTYTIYHDKMGSGFSDYFPVFSGVSKSNYVDESTGVDEESQPRDQRISVFARWVMPESHAEFYFQYAKNDHNYNLRDALTEPEHQRAYLAGLRKLIPLAKPMEYIQVGLEVIQLEGSGNKGIRSGGNFYTHGQVRDGYTNNGQILGAGIGSGSNLQSLDVSWVRGLKKIGFQFERIVQNNDLFYTAFTASKNYRRHWVDLGFTGKFDWDYKRFVVSSQLSYIKSLNYQYRFNPEGDFFWNWKKQDANNVQLKVGLLYKI